MWLRPDICLTDDLCGHFCALVTVTEGHPLMGIGAYRGPAPVLVRFFMIWIRSSRSAHEPGPARLCFFAPVFVPSNVFVTVIARAPSADVFLPCKARAIVHVRLDVFHPIARFSEFLPPPPVADMSAHAPSLPKQPSFSDGHVVRLRNCKAATFPALIP